MDLADKPEEDAVRETLTLFLCAQSLARVPLFIPLISYFYLWFSQANGRQIVTAIGPHKTSVETTQNLSPDHTEPQWRAHKTSVQVTQNLSR